MSWQLSGRKWVKSPPLNWGRLQGPEIGAVKWLLPRSVIPGRAAFSAVNASLVASFGSEG